VAASLTHHDVAPIPDFNAPIENSDMEDEVLFNLPSTDKYYFSFLSAYMELSTEFTLFVFVSNIEFGRLGVLA
jgi:hypothetical protein